MPTKELSLLDQPNNLPAHLQGFESGVTTSLMAAVGTMLNRIGTKGCRFRQVIKGEEVGVFEENYLDVIIVGAVETVSRRFYQGGYDPNGDNGAPSCYSRDGVVPAADVKIPQAEKCQLCPQNVKGSKMTEGGLKAKACSYFRRLVVMLAGDPEGILYRLDVTGMGLFGESEPKLQKYNLNDFAKALQNRNMDAGQIVTRLSFDTDQSVPKLMFKPFRFITEEEMQTVLNLTSDEKEPYLDVSMKTVDISGEAEPAQEEEEAAPAPAPAPRKMAAPKATQAPRRAPAPAPAPAEEEADEGLTYDQDGNLIDENGNYVEEAATPAPAPAPRQRPAAAPQQAAPAKRAPVPAPQRAAPPAPQRAAAPAPQKAAPAKPAARAAAPAPVVQEVGSDAELENLMADMGL
jgi:hypothetical protein